MSTLYIFNQRPQVSSTPLQISNQTSLTITSSPDLFQPHPLIRDLTSAPALLFKKLLSWIATILLVSALMVIGNVPVDAKEVSVQNPTRLNVLMREQFASLVSENGDSLLDLYWFSHIEKTAQEQQKTQLLENLSKLDNNFPSRHPFLDLIHTLESLPVTGRVVVPYQDSRWLQANPKFDPVVLPGDTVGIVDPQSPFKNAVTVVREDGSVCTKLFQASVYANYYVQSCDPNQTFSSDQAWLVQADGSVHPIGLAQWNASPGPRPSPGSWIWAPSRNSALQQIFQELPLTSNQRISESVSFQIASYLASLGPSSRDAFHASNASQNAVMDSNETKPVTKRESDLMAMRDINQALLDNARIYEPSSSPISAGDWGGVGLLQTPTARMREAGNASFTFSNINPYQLYNIMLQPFNDLEIGYRYSKITNVLYGPDIAGSQSYTDKSADVKLRVLHESYYLPELAIGMRDLIGTGLFSSEYIVANKRFGPLDFSLGLGFGYMGSRGNVKNPFSFLSSGFNNRPTLDVGQGGQFNFNSYFHGPAAFIGGFQYQTPIQHLTIKAELDGNNYQNEPFGNNQPQKSPFNFGAVYQMQNTDISFGLERGNTIMFSLSFHENLKSVSTPKFLEAPFPEVQEKSLSRTSQTTLKDPSPQSLKLATQLDTPPVLSSSIATPEAQSKSLAPISYQQTLYDIETASAWHPTELRQDGTSWIVTIDPNFGYYLTDRIDRIIAILHRDAPVSIQTFILRFNNESLKIADYKVNRYLWMEHQTQLLPPSILAEQAMITPMRSHNLIASDTNLDNPGPNSRSLASQGPKPFTLTPNLSYQQIVGSPDAFILFALSAQLDATAQLWKGAWLSGTSSLMLVDNFGKFTYLAPSNLPRVRTYVGEYLNTSALTLPNLQFTQVAQSGQSNYFSAYGGYLEMMYAGFGGEWLYRPRLSSVAVGVDVNQVYQRDFMQNFNFRDYQVTTGHLTTYWQTPFENLLLKASVGQYLAGDRGYTIDVSRVFDNGLKMGAYFTRTNISAEQFGEGSFDKGIYVSLPFDAFFSKYTGSTATFMYEPLYRDGGAKLNRRYQLYDMTNQSNPDALRFGPPNP